MRKRYDLTVPFVEYERRLKELRERMAERRLDAVVITDPENLMYLTDYQTTGYSFFQALVVPLESDAFMITRAMEESNVHARTDRKSTRLNSSHVAISYAVFCLKKKTVHEPLLV